MAKTCVFLGETLAAYGFPGGHPFSTARHVAYQEALQDRGLLHACCIREPRQATADELGLFHRREYIERVRHQSESGHGYLDAGDTPAFPGVYEAAATVAGTTVAAVDAILDGDCRHAFVPIAGLHHARRNGASGFCVFNDIGVAIEHLFSAHALESVLYVDIDAHHGDGVFYSYTDDERVIFLDFHQHSATLYPGTGRAEETGTGGAQGKKLNIELLPQSRDETFFEQWSRARKFIDGFSPQFVLLQCGVDSLRGDPITDLHLSEAAHRFVTEELIGYAEQHCSGRLLALGGGGYNLENISNGWTAVTESMLNA
ncbi:MAG: acetoin utilization protein AcuC [Proteobacteria bacterium]|nr:acetoin utilization protein AcuC [Pseudomonadota bacterium]